MAAFDEEIGVLKFEAPCSANRQDVRCRVYLKQILLVHLPTGGLSSRWSTEFLGICLSTANIETTSFGIIRLIDQESAKRGVKR